MWLQSKLAGGRDDFVAAELRKLHEHLLSPMGVASAPATLTDAITAYLAAREECERRLGSRVPRTAEDTVIPALRP